MECEIVYFFVSRNKKIILSDFSEYTGNFQQISLLVNEKMQENSNSVVTYEHYQFYIISEGGLSYLLLASNMMKPHAFSLLDDIKQAFRKKYPKERINQSYSFQLKEFDSDIKSICSFYRSNPNYAKQGAMVNKLKNEPLEIFEINSDALFTNNERVELIANKLQSNNNNSKIEDDFIEQMESLKERKRKRILHYTLIISAFLLSLSVMIFLISRVF